MVQTTVNVPVVTAKRFRQFSKIPLVSTAMEPALVAMEQGKGNLNVILVMGRAHSKVIVASAKGLVFIRLLPSYALNAMALVFWAYKYAKNAGEPANSNQR